MKSPYLEVALGAVKSAEEVITKYMDQGVRAELKEDQSPVTVADREAEEIIKRVVGAKFPSHTFYGEEGEKVDLHNHRGFTWIIDPIDGTKSYLRGNPLFSTLVALLHDGEFVLGLSNAPLMRETVWAEKGHGCYLNGNQVHVSGVEAVPDAYMSYGSLKLFAKRGQLEPLEKLAESVRWARGIGDFWSYHLLAQGKLDVMVEADTKLWDIAAFKVIVEEAGGRFTQLDGGGVGEATYSALATNGRLHDEVLQSFGQ